MPLTREQINQIRAEDGLPPIESLQTGNAGVDRVQELNNAWGIKTPNPSSFGQRVKADIKARGEKNVDILTGQAPESQGEPAIVRSLQATANTVGAIPEVAGEVVKSVGSHFRTPGEASFEKITQDKLKPNQVDPLAPKVQTPEEEQQQIAMKEKRQSLAPGAQLPSVFDAIGEKLYELEKTHPEVAKSIESILKVAKASGEVAGTVASADVAGLGLNKVPGLGTNVAEIPGIAKNLASTTETIIPKAVDAITSVPGKVANRLSNAVKGKSLEEILATPETELHKLTDSERKVYFNTQQEKLKAAHDLEIEDIKRKSADIENRVRQETDAKLQKIQGETKLLEREVATASIEEAQKLKPKVIAAMRENSKTYRSLVEKEIEPVRDMYIEHSKLIEKIRNDAQQKAAAFHDPRFITDAEKQIDILNLANGKTSKVGEVYDQIKDLKQSVKNSGTKVTSSSEVDVADAINTLSNYLRDESGVSFTEANKFWANYAPLRDKLVRSIQPFTPAGSETATFKTFAKSIQDAVQGTDPYNENFIKEAENLLGTKIGNEKTRTALERLTRSQKEEILAKAEKEFQLQEAKLQKELLQKQKVEKLTELQKSLAQKEFEAERQSRIRKYFLKALAGLGITGTSVIVGNKVLNAVSN